MKTDTHRQLTTREARIRRAYTKVWKIPADRSTKRPVAYLVRLTVGVQSFTLAGDFDDKAGAEWHRTMLACALAKIEL